MNKEPSFVWYILCSAGLWCYYHYIWLGLNERLFQGKVSGVFVLLFISELRTSFIVILDGSCFMLNEKLFWVLLNEKLFVSYMWSTATITAIALAHEGVSPYDFKCFVFSSIFYSKVSNLTLTQKKLK